jgi:hypothetical protein
VGTGCIKSVLPALALPRSGSTVEDFSLPLSLVDPNSRVVHKDTSLGSSHPKTRHQSPSILSA